MSNYEKQADDFVKKTGIKVNKQYIGHSFYFPDDTEPRAVFLITLSRGDESISFNFGNSIMNSYEVKNTNRPIKFRPLNQFYINLKGYKEAVHTAGGHIQNNLYLIKSNTPPSNYDILSCLSAESHDPGTFEDDFCPNFGYDPDSRKAEQLYFACQKQYNKINSIFTTNEIEELREI